MATVRQMLDRLESFNPIEAAGSAMLQEREQIIAINTEQLYEQGKDSEGVELSAYRWREYAEYKRDRRGRSIVDLYDTGAFQSRFNLRVEDGLYEINSSDDKTPKLVAKYGAKIFGLTDEGKVTAWKIIRPDFVQQLKTTLQV
jgi:hypothetical protein